MRLSIFEEVLRAPDAFAFLTPEEADLVHERFPGSPDGDVVGIGVEMDRPGDADAFRRRYELGSSPYLLYVGRVDPAKGASELIDYFVAYKRRNPGDLKLVLLGELLVDDPAGPDVVTTGFVDEPTRNDALAGALALVHPSYFESFAMVLTETFAQRRPALVQRRCAVLDGHAHRSGGAVPYSGFAEFEAAVDLLVASPELADALGEAGGPTSSATTTGVSSCLATSGRSPRSPDEPDQARAGGFSSRSRVARVTRSASRPIAMTWNAANRISNVSAATCRWRWNRSTISLTKPIPKSVRPTGMKMRSGLYERIMRTTWVA